MKILPELKLTGSAVQQVRTAAQIDPTPVLPDVFRGA
ncbi:MAG: hypothetical protein ACD_39C00370G0002 [uncultured bacterium]|nr:MAG: hypothetical protein ACD_39C00370G0002 [uncultured bacterium]